MGLFYIKEDTAIDIKLGPFVDKGDGVTYEVGMGAAMDNAATGVRLSKNGGAFADRSEGTQPAYDAFGYYLVKLDGTDTNTPGRLKVIFGDAAVCLPCEANFQIVHANVFDSLFGAAAADYLQVDTIQVTGTGQTANDNGADINAILVDTDTMEADLTTEIDANEAKIDTAIVDIAAVKAETVLIVADTGELQTDWVNAGRLDAILDSILAMLDDARGEPAQGAPLVNPDAMTKLDWVYKFLRNKITNDGTDIKVYNDAGAVVDHKAGVSEAAGTVTRDEFASGP